MSIETVSKNKKTWRLGVFLIAALVVVMIWIGLGLGLLFEAPRTLTIPLVIAAAFGTEILFWLGAVLLGWSIFSNRRSLWDRLTGRTNEETSS